MLSGKLSATPPAGSCWDKDHVVINNLINIGQDQSLINTAEHCSDA